MSLIYKGQTIANVGGSGGVGSSSGGSSEEIYSTEETRIGTWIDGKPLYRKAFIYDATGYTANKDITIYTDSTIDSFTFYYGLEITSGYTLMCNAYTGPD